MLPLSVTVFNQVQYLLRNLNESNSDTVLHELCQYIGYGVEASILVLYSCLYYLNVYTKDLKSMQMEPVLASIFRYLLQKSNFSTVFSEALRSTEVCADFLESLCNALQFSASEKIGIGFSLSDSENQNLRICGKNFCMSQIEDLCANRFSVDSTEQIQKILIFLRQTNSLTKHLGSFVQMLQAVQLKENNAFILEPLLSTELRESSFLRNLDLFNENNGDDFDALQAEMEKEINISDVMRQMGYGFTGNVSQCKNMLSLFSPLTESTIAKILGTISRAHADVDDNRNLFMEFCSALGFGSFSDLPPAKTWNTNVLVDSIKQLAPGINWINVIENLDHEGFYIPNEAAFSLFISMYRAACKDPFPLGAICGSVWKNAEGQLSFLKYAVSVPPELFTFAHSGKQLSYAAVMNGHKNQPGYANHAWLCLDLLEVLCQLAERGQANSVRQMLEHPLKHCPELLLLGMAHINTAFNLLPYEVTSTVFPLVLESPAGNSMALHIWHVNPNLLLRGVIDTFRTNPVHMIRVLELCQELKILPQVLDFLPSCFGVRLAFLASKRELLDLEKWLTVNLTAYKEIFFKECLKFVKEVQSGAPVAPLNPSPGTCSIFLKVLQAHTGLISSGQLSEEIEKLHKMFMDASSIMKTSDSIDASTAKDIEAEANSYFQKLFSGQLTLETMIQMLARFKDSSEKREELVFNCMITNLFEEYKFFSKYPDRQLKIAAVLVGLLIKFQLVGHISLGLALQAVLDSLRKPTDSKMFLFGVKALEQFLDRMVEWPQYCNHILQISHLRSTHSEIISFVERSLSRISSGHSEPDLGLNPTALQLRGSLSSANLEMPNSSSPRTPPIGSSSVIPGTPFSSSLSIQQQHRQQNSLEDRQKGSSELPSYMKPVSTPNVQPPAVPSPDPASIQKSKSAVGASGTLVPSPGFTRPSRSTTSAKFGSAMNIETLVAAAEKRETPIEAPASEIQDKIFFIMNNLSATNIEAKSKEVTEYLKEEHCPWFAQYLVMKRASIEHNHHEMYLKFLEKINLKTLDKEVLQSSYENCKVLLRSDLIKSSSEERSLLKNLGSWLGKITIGWNQVLRAREIDPKSLIIEAYEKGLMIAVVPFTSRILDACQTSAAYRPPNPWTMGVLGLLVEIHSMPNLKMNLKFEIEVLFKNLRVDMKDVTPTSLLKNRVREVEGNPDFSSNDFRSSQSQKVTEVKSTVASTSNNVNQAVLPPDIIDVSHPSGNSQVLIQYAAPQFSSGTLTEDEKLASLSLSVPPPAAQGLPQGQLPISIQQLHASTSIIEQQIIVNPKLNDLGLQLHFQSVLPIAMDRAIKDIVSSIVQRSVTIATQTTKEIVLKDFAMESDETRIHNAARSMVATLASSLAHVTCKEPLRVSISSQLGRLLQDFNISGELLEQIGQLVTNDNLNLGCALIERAATDKALQIIDVEVGKHLAIRRKHKESVGPAYFDATLYTQGYMGVLPESLRPKPGRLSASQQRVYEDFVRLPWKKQSIQISDAAPSASGVISTSRGNGSARAPQSTGIYSSAEGSTAETDSNSSKLHSENSINIRVEDDADPQTFIKDAVSNSVSSSPAPELHLAKPCKAVKEFGANNISEPLLNTGDALNKYQIISEKLQTCVSNDAKETEIQAIIAEVPGVILRCISRDEAALAVAQKVFKGLYENASNSAHVKAHLAILAAIRDVSKLVCKELTSWVIYSDEDRKFNKDVTVGLIRSELLNLAEYNFHMAKLLDAGRNKLATEFSISLLQTLVTSDSRVTISELHYLVDALAKVASKPGSPESLKQLVEIARNPNASNVSALPSPSVGNDDNTRQAGDEKSTAHSTASKEDNNPETAEPFPASFHEKVSMLFAEWYRICELPGANDEIYSQFVLKLFKHGLLKGDHVTVCYFCKLMEISISHCLSSELNKTTQQSNHQVQQPLSFLAIDMYAGLVLSILKFFPGDEELGKIILAKVLVMTVKYIQIDAEEKKQSFNSRPYYRLFINWLMDLPSLETLSDGVNFWVLTALANVFHRLPPLQIPGFSFAWLELVSHRNFMPKLLVGNAQKGWPYFQRLLMDLFQFLEPYLRNAELSDPVSLLYKGTLRVLLVLLHDFPEFLSDYHFSFCDVIPSTCIQLRNIILSAYPRYMRLPEPNTPNLKIDLLVEISQSPHLLSEVDAAIKAPKIKGDIDDYIMTRKQGSPFLYELKQKLMLDPNEATRCGTRYNIPLMNSLVLYLGMQAIQLLQGRTPPPTQQKFGGNVQLPIHTVGGPIDIFKWLMIDLDSEGRYLFLNAMVNQLRYPNNHTHYFSRILLHLFDESNQEVIQEQISRVLLERIIVNRPHPWGLLVTFIELIKNPMYNFWNRSFIRCIPEIEKIFESVLRSCGGPKPVDDSVNEMNEIPSFG